jgi:hypothetical protein
MNDAGRYAVDGLLQFQDSGLVKLNAKASIGAEQRG